MEGDFRLTEEQKELLFNDPDFCRVVSRVVFKDSSSLVKSYEDLIIDEVCSSFSIDREGLMSKSQKHCYTLPRFVAMYLMVVESKQVKRPLSDIAEMFGRHRTIINHAVRTVEWESFADRKVEKIIKRIRGLIKTKSKTESTV